MSFRTLFFSVEPITVTFQSASRVENDGAQRDVETAVDDTAHIGGVITRLSEMAIGYPAAGRWFRLYHSTALKGGSNGGIRTPTFRLRFFPRHVFVLDRVEDRTRPIGIRVVHVVERPPCVGSRGCRCPARREGLEGDVVRSSSRRSGISPREMPRSAHRPEGSQRSPSETRRGVHAGSSPKIVASEKSQLTRER